MKIRPVGAEFFHADRRTDGQTDMANLIIAFRNFPNAPKNELYTSKKTLPLRHRGWKFIMSQRLHFSLDVFLNAQYSGHDRKVGVYMYKTSEVRNEVSHPCQT